MIDILTALPNPDHRSYIHLMKTLPTKQNVKAQYQLATEHLKLRSAHAVMGKSMGAGQTFQWAVQYPDFMKKQAFHGEPRHLHHIHLRRRFPSFLFLGW